MEPIDYPQLIVAPGTWGLSAWACKFATAEVKLPKYVQLGGYIGVSCTPNPQSEQLLNSRV